MKRYTSDGGRTYWVLMGSSAGILTARDPADPFLQWTTEQYSDNAARCVYSTRIIQYEIASGKSYRTARSRQKRSAGQ